MIQMTKFTEQQIYEICFRNNPLKSIPNPRCLYPRKKIKSNNQTESALR